MDSICTASRRILWICLSIISSAALAGSMERMNRFIMLMVCVCVCPITASIFWGLKRFNFPKYFCNGRKIEIKMYEYLEYSKQKKVIILRCSV